MKQEKERVLREQEAEKDRMRKLEEENRRLKEESKTQATRPKVEAVTVTRTQVKPKALRPPSQEGTPKVVNKADEVKPVGIE